MTHFTNEHEIRLHVKVLKSFYEESCFYALICLGLVVVWLFQGGGQFWPVLMISIWGVPLFLKASRIGVISESFYNIFNHLRHMLPIFKPEWEEQKIEQLAYLHELRDAVSAPPLAEPTLATVSPAAPVVRPVVKRTAPQAKPAARKVVKAVAKKAAPAAKKPAKKVLAKATKPVKKKATKPVKKAVKKVVKKAAPKKTAAKKPAAKKTVKKKK